MIITHASNKKIEQVNDVYFGTPFLKGCLCFGAEGNEYNLAGDCKYQYNIEVESIIPVKSFFFRHSYDEPAVQEVFKLIREDLELESHISDETIANLLDDSEFIHIRNFQSDDDYSPIPHRYSDDGEACWAIQQYQGILAHKLGYDCARSTDEQGTVYIAYCVGRPLLEVPCE